jgi:phosphatidylethanolamine N-methyltransferase
LADLLVDKPKDPESVEEIKDLLRKFVVTCLDRDPKLVPRSALHLVGNSGAADLSELDQAPDGRTSDDDFVIFTPDQAQHIAYAIKEVGVILVDLLEVFFFLTSCGSIRQAFNVDLVSDVVIADANVSKLAQTIVEAKRVLRPFASAAGAA